MLWRNLASDGELLVVSFDLVLALFLLVYGPLSVLWALATPVRRARARAGGVLHPAYLLVLYLPLGLVFLARAKGHDLGALTILGMVPFVLVGRWHRRRTATVPEETLSPTQRWLRDNDNLSIGFAPRAQARYLRELARHVWSREARQEQKEWERAQGLR